MNKLRKIILFIIVFTALLPFQIRADEFRDDATTFKAQVIDILRTQEKPREDGSTYVQQDLKLRALEGALKNQEIIYRGIADLDVVSINYYDIGDRVYIDSMVDESGVTTFYVVDFVRTRYIYILSIIFIAVVLLVGRFKGFKALLSLMFSFFVIVEFILPQILAGYDPFIISLIGGLGILGTMIYLTEGFNRKSHIAILSVLFSLIITLVLSIIFTKLTKLSGLSQEEATFLIGASKTAINFQGLLLAGFIIGATGVLDDIVVGQIEAVESIREANPSLSTKKLFSLAYRVGNTHLGAIINTLFLTYAGASLPLLLLFVLNQSTGLTLDRAINTESISTEVVRTLVGSIGVMLSMPIATFLASISHKK
ncbi:MAG: YibE/F family protein [Patescibacteria group bacterium]|nr:YibE/F family protein [Patescibacteria group bacterium]